MLNELKTTLEEELLKIPDRALLIEMKVYDRDELNVVKADPDASNHFDILIACAICWEMRKHVVTTAHSEAQDRMIQENENNYEPNPYI